MTGFLKMLLNLTLAPAKGWEDVADAHPDQRSVLLHGLIPLSGISAVAVFARAFYNSGLTIAALTICALATFLQFFLSYYIALFLLSWFMPALIPVEEYDDNRVANFCALTTGLLAVISIIADCVPVELSLVHFLPVYVIIIIWQGRHYLRIEPAKQIRFVIYATISVMLPLYLLDLMFGLFNV